MPRINPPRPRNYDDMRFGEAFRMARQGALKGGPKTFMWRGKAYTTELKEERQARVGRGRRGPNMGVPGPGSGDVFSDVLSGVLPPGPSMGVPGPGTGDIASDVLTTERPPLRLSLPGAGVPGPGTGDVLTDPLARANVIANILESMGYRSPAADLSLGMEQMPLSPGDEMSMPRMREQNLGVYQFRQPTYRR